MAEIVKIFLTSSLTIIGGFVVLVLGQFAIKLIVEPIQQLREVIGEIGYNLVFYANVISNPEVSEPETLLEAKNIFRKSAALLLAKSSRIVGYSVFSFFVIPKKDEISEAGRRLIRLSNTSANRTDPVRLNDDIEQIKILLRLEKPLLTDKKLDK